MKDKKSMKCELKDGFCSFMPRLKRLCIFIFSFILHPSSFIFFSSFILQPSSFPHVLVGVDLLFEAPYEGLLKGKRVGLITNQTGINSKLESTIELFKRRSVAGEFSLVALFAPEHGLRGDNYAAVNVKDQIDSDQIPIYSLHGDTRRPTEEMLKKIDVLVFDIQDVGARSYTYASTLYYAMEEAAKRNIAVIVADRPNPINGIVIDGPMLEDAKRSFVGYVNVPYCHGMTIGELAQFFNEEYHVGCILHVVPMKGWNRLMSFKETGLTWIPTSPHIPEADTPLYYPITGLLGELQLVSIGIGYTLPFKVVGAPWIKAQEFADFLNKQHFPGIFFYPYYFKPFFGRYARESCEGILIVVTDPKIYKPVSSEYLIIGALKSLYPVQFEQALTSVTRQAKEMFAKVNGTDEIFQILENEKFIILKLKELQQKERDLFAEKRKKYLITSYSEK